MKDKKGMEVFHWILIMIVGAVILLFGVIFAGKSGGVEQQKQNVLVVEYLEMFFNPFTSVGAIADSFGKKVSLPYEIDAELRCEGGKEFLFVGSGGKISSEKIENFVYTPSKIKARELFVLTKSFEIPFRVTDLIFTFDSGQKFCVIYDEQDAGQADFVDQLKGDIEGRLVDAQGNFAYCQDIGCCMVAGSTRIISLNAQKGDVNLVPQGADGEGFSFGEVTWAAQGAQGSGQGAASAGRKSVFVSSALAEAAIFSDYPLYSCNLRRLMSKTGSVSDIYSEKANYLGAIAQPQVCNYNALRGDLQQIKPLAGSVGSAQSLSSARALNGAAQEFETKNMELPCIQIY